MARSHGRISVKDKPGNAIQNALVELFLEGTTTPVTDAWSAKTGGILTPTVLTNSGGIAEFWLDTAKTITARISSNSNQAFYAGSSDKANLATQSVTVEVHPNPEDIAGGGGGGGTTPDATSTVKGKLQLAGDLGGTAASPTVPGLASKANDSAVVHSSLLLAKGDLIGASGAGTPVRIPGGSSNGQVPIWDTTQTANIRWGTGGSVDATAIHQDSTAERKTGPLSVARVITEAPIDPTNPRWGAACDNSTDDTTAWTNIIAWLSDTATLQAARIVLPGISVVSSTLNWRRFALHIEGWNWGGKRTTGPGMPSGFRWAGSNSVPMFKFIEAYGCLFENFFMVGPCSALMEFNDPNDGLGIVRNSRNTFRHVWVGKVQGFDTGTSAAKGLTTSGANFNGDQWVIDDCIFSQLPVAIDLVNTQNGAGEINNTRFDQCGIGLRTVTNMRLANPLFSGCTTRDLELIATDVFVSGLTSEASAQMALLTGTSQLVVQGRGWQVSNALVGSGSAGVCKIIDFADPTGHSAVRLRDFSFTLGPAYTNPGTPKIGMVPTADSGAFKELDLDNVAWTSGQGISDANIDAIIPVSWSPRLVIRGFVRGATQNSAYRHIYNHLDLNNRTPDFTRNDWQRVGLVPLRVKAGVVADADFPFTPPDGTQAYDSTNHKHGIREGGVWKWSGAYT